MGGDFLPQPKGKSRLQKTLLRYCSGGLLSGEKLARFWLESIPIPSSELRSSTDFESTLQQLRGPPAFDASFDSAIFFVFLQILPSRFDLRKKIVRREWGFGSLNRSQDINSSDQIRIRIRIRIACNVSRLFDLIGIIVSLSYNLIRFPNLGIGNMEVIRVSILVFFPTEF